MTILNFKFFLDLFCFYCIDFFTKNKTFPIEKDVGLDC